jgi:hypothetical protein
MQLRRALLSSPYAPQYLWYASSQCRFSASVIGLAVAALGWAYEPKPSSKATKTVAAFWFIVPRAMAASLSLYSVTHLEENEFLSIKPVAVKSLRGTPAFACQRSVPTGEPSFANRHYSYDIPTRPLRTRPLVVRTATLRRRRYGYCGTYFGLSFSTRVDSQLQWPLHPGWVWCHGWVFGSHKFPNLKKSSSAWTPPLPQRALMEGSQGMLRASPLITWLEFACCRRLRSGADQSRSALRYG